MKTVATRLVLALLIFFTGCARANEKPSTRPVPDIQHVIIISIDGCRPDLLLRANTPFIHKLLETSSFSFWARTTAESVTLPSHTSMLTGVVPIKHGIQWNADLPLEHPYYTNVPTLLYLAKEAGYTTAMCAGKSKFINLAKPGTLDWQFISDTPTMKDDDVVDQALIILKEHQPDILFVHLPNVDNTGHASGWSSPQQMKAIENADAQIGRLFATLDDLKLRDNTFSIITADHGGAGRMHGPDDARSRHIPWIATGPGIRKGLDLTIYGQLQIDTEDTFSTVAYLLGIPVIRPVDGHPVLEIIDQSDKEMMK